MTPPLLRTETVGELSCETGEGAVWSAADAALYGVDIWACTVFRIDPVTGAARAWDMPEMAGCLVAVRTGGVIAGLASKLVFIAGDVVATIGAPPATHDPATHRFNEATAAPDGGLIVGSMRLSQLGIEPTGLVWHVSPTGVWREIDRGLMTINGMAFSPDGKTLYYSDSHPSVQTVWKRSFEIETGAFGPKSIFVDYRDLAGRPDGATVSDEGHYVSAAVGGWSVHVFSRDGALVKTLAAPVEKPSKPAFGGPGLDELFVTTLAIGLDETRAQPLAGRVLRLRDHGLTGSVAFVTDLASA